MCEYSLEFMASRPAKVETKLVITRFPHSITHGFCGCSREPRSFSMRTYNIAAHSAFCRS
jgi:hypothetical protein